MLVAIFTVAVLAGPSCSIEAVPPESTLTTKGSVVIGAFTSMSSGNLSTLYQYDSEAKRKAVYAHWFQSWEPQQYGKFLSSLAQRLHSDGRTPLLTWEPQDGTVGTAYQPDYSLDTIISGKHDNYIRTYAQDIRGSGVPIYLRLMHEMNGDWYPWGDSINGNTPEMYKQAWIHIHNIFEAEGATNVKWVWCPNEVSTWTPSHPMADFYPGDSYVDWIALDGYNWAGADGSPWYSFEEVFGKSYDEILGVAPTKPLMISEFASDERGGSKAQWIRDIRTVVPTRFPKIKALIWFNKDQDGAFWKIDSSASALQAYQELVADPSFQGTEKVLADFS